MAIYKFERGEQGTPLAEVTPEQRAEIDAKVSNLRNNPLDIESSRVHAMSDAASGISYERWVALDEALAAVVRDGVSGLAKYAGKPAEIHCVALFDAVRGAKNKEDIARAVQTFSATAVVAPMPKQKAA